jgi:hypothetical protein
MGSPQKSPHLVRREARICVQLWSQCHSTELNQWTAEARRELWAAKTTGDGKKASVAAGSFAEKIFSEAQCDLSYEVRSTEIYEAALRVLVAIIRMHVVRLIKNTLGTSPGVAWTACFTKRMRRLVDACRQQVSELFGSNVELFKSDIGLVTESGQEAEIVVDGPGQGLRIRSSPTDFSKYLRNRIRSRGFRSIGDLAKQSLLSPTVIHKLLKGGRVNAETLSVLADALEIPFVEFVEVVHRHWEESEQKVHTE